MITSIRSIGNPIQILSYENKRIIYIQMPTYLLPGETVLVGLPIKVIRHRHKRRS